MSALFSPITLGQVTLPNRVIVSPMCMYSAVDGVPQPWHARHLGTLAISGAALVIAEATGVTPEGRISPDDTGLWNDAQEAAWQRILADIRTYSSTRMGIQLAHAGRKASTASPWKGHNYIEPVDGGWVTVAPSPVAFHDYAEPAELDAAGMARIREAWADAARRAQRAGFDAVELHAAHGYLLHEFASPLSNHRTDAYGGPLENRLRFPLEVASAVREAWPRDRILGARITGSDWVEGGVTPQEARTFAEALKAIGYDYVCVSSGAVIPGVKIPGREPAYQLPFAEVVKAAGLPTMTVGMVVTPRQAEDIVASGKADMVALARAMLDDPNWGHHARVALGLPEDPANQYARAANSVWPGYAMAHPQG